LLDRVQDHQRRRPERSPSPWLGRPRPGKARHPAEHRPAFREKVKWRTGSEGRISSLKRGSDQDWWHPGRPNLDRTGHFRTQLGRDRV